MSSAYTFLPTQARHSLKCCFPKKSAAPPSIALAPGEPADDSFDPTVYLLHVQVDSLAEKVAVSTSNNEIKVYSMDNLSLTAQLNGHTAPVTDIKFSAEDANVLVSSSEDGTVSLWDVRSSERTCLNFESKEVWRSVAIAGSTVAAGAASGCVGFWDIRSGSHGVLRDYFSEDVSQLSFHPVQRHILFAGSYDGLICQVDSSAELGDDAVLDVLNVGTSVSKMGIFGAQSQLMYTLAPTEQLQIWNLDTSAKLADYGFDLLTLLTELTGGDVVNYIVDLKYDATNDTLLLFAGSFNGAIYVFACLGTETPFKYLTKLTGHSAIVRDAWLHEQGNLAVTVGEDSMLFQWAPAGTNSSSSSSSKPPLTTSFSTSNRNKPY